MLSYNWSSLLYLFQHVPATTTALHPRAAAPPPCPGTTDTHVQQPAAGRRPAGQTREARMEGVKAAARHFSLTFCVLVKQEGQCVPGCVGGTVPGAPQHHTLGMGGTSSSRAGWPRAAEGVMGSHLCVLHDTPGQRGPAPAAPHCRTGRRTLQGTAAPPGHWWKVLCCGRAAGEPCAGRHRRHGKGAVLFNQHNVLTTLPCCRCCHRSYCTAGATVKREAYVFGNFAGRGPLAAAAAAMAVAAP
ncbi:hypothetical protein E2C01_041883 [Portunus trituberculatus]|uniref:Uncharacterized protein n=1 Tax=Portunus trituberculatus TaxID=210409 RepID=A0A5B7FRW6_PORTR|nr:hypothetical protein [Portunus trituberculatus]